MARPEIRSSLSQHAARQRLCGLKLHKPCLNKAASPEARHDYIEQEDMFVMTQSGRGLVVIAIVVVVVVVMTMWGLAYLAATAAMRRAVDTVTQLQRMDDAAPHFSFQNKLQPQLRSQPHFPLGD
jgi:galactose-1-phosphate uridylyltransferase